MALQQTRYTYPTVRSKLVRLKYRHGQKYHLESFGYGGVELAASQAKVYFWRYVGRRKGRFSIAGYDPSDRQWDDIVINEENLEELMRLQGFELVGVALGSGGSEYQATSGSTNVVGYGEKTFTIGFNLPFKPGMRVRASDANNPANYMEGTIASYKRADMVMIPDTISGAASTDEWNISVRQSIFADDADWDTSFYTDINTWNPIFGKPGLYADTWIINDSLGQFGPTINYFRLESNLQGAIWDIPRHHFRCDVWPGHIPFPASDFNNPDFDMMVGVTPYTKNVLNPASYQVFQTLMSTMYVELIEIWFYEHETEGPLDPPEKVSFSSPIQFTEQVFNFFWGKVPPSIFNEPGEYRLKFRVRTDQGAPTMDGAQYHDFWKTMYVDRSVQEISDPISQCYKNAIDVYGSLSQCSYMLRYDDAGQHLTHLAKGSASDFAEPRDKEETYDSSQVKYLNVAQILFNGSGTQVQSVQGVSDHFAPLVIADGLQLNPSEPLRGYGVDGALVRDYTVEGNVIKYNRNEFTQVLLGYFGNEPFNIGKVEIIFRDYASGFLTGGGNYAFVIPQRGYNNNFNMLFIQDIVNKDTRLVVPPSAYFIAPGTVTYLVINKTWLESVIAQTIGVYYFRLQLYASTSVFPGPESIRTHLSLMEFSRMQLPGRPKYSRFPEMLFREGKPQFRHFDYGIYFQSISTTSHTIVVEEKTFITQQNKPFYPGARVVAYSLNGDYVRGRILSYEGDEIRIDVDQTFGLGNTYNYWVIYMEDIDSSNIDFYFSGSYGDKIFAVYDSEV